MSIENPEITVIIPAYNAGAYLADCLDSIIGQSFTDWELIAADDGSSDNTGELLDKYAAADNRIKVIHTAEKGVSAARNACMKICRGKYIAFIDADDHIKTDYLDALYSHAVQSGADITQCSFSYLYENGKLVSDPNSIEEVYDKPETILHAYFRGQYGDITTSVWAKLFRTEAFKDMWFDTGLRVFEDADFVFRCCKKAKIVCCFDSQLYYYFQHGGSTTHSHITGIWRDYYSLYDRQLEEFRNERIIRKSIERRKTETGLWLIRSMILEGKQNEIWEIRKRLLRITWSVIFSSAPFHIKAKLIMLSLMPRLFISMLKKKIASEQSGTVQAHY